VAIAVLCVAFFLLPQPKPRYKPGEEPTEAEKSSE
jgi:TMEM175 potassium channel family protein